MGKIRKSNIANSQHTEYINLCIEWDGKERIWDFSHGKNIKNCRSYRNFVGNTC